MEAGRKRSVRETAELPPSITEIAGQAGVYRGLYSEDLDSLMWLMVRHRHTLINIQ